MIIHKIRFSNFRNHGWLEINDPASLMIIIGDNATGKTNIIEGLQLLCMQASFRNPTTNELLNKENIQDCKIVIEFSNNQRQLELALQVEDNHKSFQLNGKSKNPAELFGILPAVLFTPDDLYLIKGPPSARRELIDNLGSRLSKTFASIKKDYSRIIKQKNLLLKSENIDAAILDSWNINLAKLGASLYVHRQGLYKKLISTGAKIYQQISNGEILSSVYITSFLDSNSDVHIPLSLHPIKSGFDGDPAIPRLAHSARVAVGHETLGIHTGAEEECEQEHIDSNSQEIIEKALVDALQEHRSEEIGAKRSLVGPHRDDINFLINGQDARRFGSQGQQRSVALALKIAEIEILREFSGSDPVLLLDDVMSELDQQRRQQLINIINNSTQTFITTTNLGYFDKQTIDRAQLLYLPVQDKRASQTGEANETG